VTGAEYAAQIGARLTAQIEDAGWTVERAARVTGIPASTLRRRLRSGKRLSCENAIVVLEALGRCDAQTLCAVMEH
jgi:Bacterial regulatory protein, Fis family